MKVVSLLIINIRGYSFKTTSNNEPDQSSSNEVSTNIQAISATLAHKKGSEYKMLCLQVSIKITTGSSELSEFGPWLESLYSLTSCKKTPLGSDSVH